MLERAADGMDITDLVADFSEQERLVLTTRFKLFNGQVDRSLKETAELLGMGDHQIRRIEDEAFEQIRYRAMFARPEYDEDHTGG